MSTPSRTLSAADVQELVEDRRELHAHPEVAFEETRTAAFVAERLRALGLEPRTGVGRTGVVATIRGARPGRTVLLRADMDALPMQEENDVPYRSRIAGRMHAWATTATSRDCSASQDNSCGRRRRCPAR